MSAEDRRRGVIAAIISRLETMDLDELRRVDAAVTGALLDRRRRQPDHLKTLEQAAVAYADTINDDDRTEFTGEAVLNAALTFARSLSKADRKRLGR